MPRTGVSYDDVAESILALEKAGLKPSIRLIREKLGRGSLSTIAEHKRAYDIESAQGPTEVLPDPIAKGLLKGAETFWQELIEAANSEIEEAQSAADTKIAESLAAQRTLEEQLATSNDQNGTLVAAVAERDERIAVLKARAEDTGTQLNDAHQDVVRLTEKLASSEAMNEERTQQILELRNDVEVTRKEHRALEKHLDRQSTNHARELAAVKEQLATESSTRKNADDALKNALADACRLESRATNAERQLSTSKADIASLKKKLRATKGELQQLHKEKQANQAKTAELSTQLKALHQAKKELLAEKDARIEELTVALENASDTAKTLETLSRRLQAPNVT